MPRDNRLNNDLDRRFGDLLAFVNDTCQIEYHIQPIIASEREGPTDGLFRYEDPWTTIRIRRETDAATAARAAMRDQVVAFQRGHALTFPTVPAYTPDMLNALSPKEAAELVALLRGFDQLLSVLASQDGIKIGTCRHCGDLFEISGAGRPSVYCHDDCRDCDQRARYQKNRDQAIQYARDLRRLKKNASVK